MKKHFTFQQVIAFCMSFGTQIIFVFLASLIFLSCRKETVDPVEEISPTPSETSFSLIGIRYSLAEGDGVDSTIHHLNRYKFNNLTASSVEQSYLEKLEGLSKTSLFIVSDKEQSLPKEFKLDSLEVPTPFEINTDNIKTAKLGWHMVDTVETQPYEEKPTEQVVTIPAYAAIMIDRTIKEYKAITSFTAQFKNDRTGQIQIVVGKWKGTLRFNNYTIKLSQKSLLK